VSLSELCMTVTESRPVERGGKGGKFSRTARRLGGPAGPPSLKNTENGVPDGFLLT